MNDFDKIIDSLGGFGPYQRQLFILTSLMDIPAAWAMLLPIFIGATPTWECQVMHEGPLFNSTNATSTNDSIGLYTSAFEVCFINNTACHRKVFDKSFTSIVTQFDLVCDKDYISDLITTLQMVGLLVGATIFGQLGDIFGRKKIMFITYTLTLVFNALSGIATSWQLYAALRFVVGASVAGLLLTNFLLPMEFVGKRWRSFVGCIGTWALGVSILSVLAYLIRSWSYLCLATSAIGLPLLATWWFVPESCRWLVTKARYEEAEAILLNMANRNNKALPDMNLLRTFAKTEKELSDQQKKFSYWHLCLSPKSALVTLTCMYAWFASSSVYYGLSYNLRNLPGNKYINVFISGIVEIPALIFVVIVNNRIGRRWTVFVLFLVSSASLLSIMIVELADKEATTGVLALAFIGKSAVSGGWAAVQIFSAEKFPTLIRNLGVAACAVGARVGGIVAPQLVYLSDFSQYLPFIIFGIIAAVCAASSVFLSETAQLPLPDTLEVHSSGMQSSDDIELTADICTSQEPTVVSEEQVLLESEPPSSPQELHVT